MTRKGVATLKGLDISCSPMLVMPDCIQHTPQEAAQKDSHQQKTYAANGNIPHPSCGVFDSCFSGALPHLRVHSMQKPGQTGCGYMSQEDLQIYMSMFNRQACKEATCSILWTNSTIKTAAPASIESATQSNAACNPTEIHSSKECWFLLRGQPGKTGAPWTLVHP